MKGKTLPWLLVALAGVMLLLAMGDPPGSNDRVVAATVRNASGVQLRATLPRKASGSVGNADLFGVAPIATQNATSSESSDQHHPRMDDKPSWNVIGKHLENPSGWAVFLAREEQTLMVRVGDVLEDGYRVDSIAPPVMVLRHVKRNTRKTLDIGEATK